MIEAMFWVGLALFLAGLVSMVLFRRPNDNEESH